VMFADRHGLVGKNSGTRSPMQNLALGRETPDTSR
jgi:hypothetical protein